VVRWLLLWVLSLWVVRMLPSEHRELEGRYSKRLRRKFVFQRVSWIQVVPPGLPQPAAEAEAAAAAGDAGADATASAGCAGGVVVAAAAAPCRVRAIWGEPAMDMEETLVTAGKGVRVGYNAAVARFHTRTARAKAEKRRAFTRAASVAAWAWYSAEEQSLTERLERVLAS